MSRIGTAQAIQAEGVARERAAAARLERIFTEAQERVPINALANAISEKKVAQALRMAGDAELPAAMKAWEPTLVAAVMRGGRFGADMVNEED